MSLGGYANMGAESVRQLELGENDFNSEVKKLIDEVFVGIKFALKRTKFSDLNRKYPELNPTFNKEFVRKTIKALKIAMRNSGEGFWKLFPNGDDSVLEFELYNKNTMKKFMGNNVRNVKIGYKIREDKSYITGFTKNMANILFESGIDRNNPKWYEILTDIVDEFNKSLNSHIGDIYDIFQVNEILYEGQLDFHKTSQSFEKKNLLIALIGITFIIVANIFVYVSGVIVSFLTILFLKWKSIRNTKGFKKILIFYPCFLSWGYFGLIGYKFYRGRNIYV
jgi:hypothetical protein